MTEIISEPVHLNCHYDVPPEVIFDAWINPEIMRKWLFIGPTSEIANIELNAQEEGQFSIIEFDKSSGEYLDHFGIYKEIEAPLQLVFTLSVPKHFPGETTVTIHIFPTLNGCELKLTQTGVPKDITESSWVNMLHALKLLVEETVESDGQQ